MSGWTLVYSRQAQKDAKKLASSGLKQRAQGLLEVLAEDPLGTPPRYEKLVGDLVDNGSSHRGRKAIDRLSEQFPNAVMVHTPVHASWLNQVEIYFSVVQRKVVSPNDFTDLNVVVKRLTDFETHYNQAAKPFKWKFTTNNLTDLLQRLEQRQNGTASPAQPRAA